MVALRRHLSNPKPFQALLKLQGEVSPIGEPGTPTQRVQKWQRRLEASEQTELVAAYRSGETMRQLAERFGVHRSTVSAILGRHGVPTHHRKFTPEQFEQAKRMYVDGMSFAKLGENFGLHSETIRRAFINAEVPIRQRRGWS